MRGRIGVAALIWGGSLMLARVIGLVREATLGRVLGGGGEADLYAYAFRVPDFLNYLLAGGALSIAFIPIFARWLAEGDEARGWRSFSVIANTILLLLAGALPLVWLATPWLVEVVVAPGANPADQARVAALTRIALPAQIFHIVGGLLSAALQARDRHALPALASLLYTGSIIVGGLVGQSPEGFVWGALVGSALGPFGLPLLGNLKEGMRWSLAFDPRDPDLRTWALRSLPIMLAFSIIVFDDTVLANQASSLGEGAVASLMYAKTLMKVPMGVFGLATGMAAYPTLTRLVAEGDRAGAYRTLAAATRMMLLLALGAQVAMTAAGPELSEVIYGGRLSAEQHHTIGLALGLFGLGLWAWSAQGLISRGFYALGQTWPPSALGTVALVLALPVYAGLRVELGLLGLPLATSLAVSAYVVALIVLLRRQFPGVPDGLAGFALRVSPALGGGLLVGAGARAAGLGALPWALPRGAALGGLAALAFFGIALAMKIPEASTLASALRRRLGRRR
jgi:putative peptidoglycan lipid II flippase